MTDEFVHLKQKQSLPLAAKVLLSQNLIRDWYNHWQGEVYVSISGGVDSTVMLDLVRSLYPDVVALFCNTGLEFPENVRQVRETDNVVWVKPKKKFKEVTEKYGFPVISKEKAQYVQQIRESKNPACIKKRLEGIPKGNGRGKIGHLPKKWMFLLDAPFKISNWCCYVMKKAPIHAYERKTGQKGFVGTMVEESYNRYASWKRYGCNAFDIKAPQSRPLSFWSKEDVWQYIKEHNLSYSKVYDMGYERTGCVACMFGIHMEKGENRFQRLKWTHNKLYKYCMGELGLAGVLGFLGIDSG
jgi:3'-phosphoadenosine 5'-phosphosulfate sulfotransferase (PAPS reductase)/FAD synthetase